MCRERVLKNVDTATIIAELLNSINAVHVVDTTYGVGRFYRYYRPKILVGIDPNIYQQYVVKPDILIPKPVWSARDIIKSLHTVYEFDVLVVDPPFRKRPRGRDNRLYYYNIVGSPELILKYSLKIASELGIPNIIVHWRDKDIVLEKYHRISCIEYKYELGYLDTRSYFILMSSQTSTNICTKE